MSSIYNLSITIITLFSVLLVSRLVEWLPLGDWQASWMIKIDRSTARALEHSIPVF